MAWLSLDHEEGRRRSYAVAWPEEISLVDAAAPVHGRAARYLKLKGKAWRARRCAPKVRSASI